MSSADKIRTNRENATHSTGPNTEEGKRTSSQNAVTHGLLAHTPKFTNAASQKRFKKLLAGLRKKYRPEDFIEERLIRQLALEYWKLELINEQEIVLLRYRYQGTLAQSPEPLPGLAGLGQTGVELGTPDRWDTDSVLIKSTEETSQQTPGTNEPGKSTRKTVSMEAQLSDPVVKLQRYGQIARKNCDRIVKELLMGRGLLED